MSDPLTYDNDTLSFEELLHQRVSKLQVEISLLKAENISLKVRYEASLRILEDIRQKIEQWLPRER